ncbi:MAG: hypothetical protein DDT39_01658 [Firmicutes bacterium]|nr:hypothetical protein [candidate division NPL-UPA2 bacterium]MBT9154968.1 hypothetical protein [candidate division NPL-UPA2 bacterium]
MLATLAGIGGLARFAELSVMLWFPLMTLLAVTFLGGHLHHLQPVFGMVLLPLAHLTQRRSRV